MKAFNKLIAGGAAAVAVVLASVVGFNAAASAACTQYNPAGTSTTATPIFNNFCGVPGNVGDETDFVRVRPSNGDPTSSSNNADYISTLNNQACNDGDGFDVRTYVHNGADPSGNASGVAIAHNVNLAMRAPIGTTNSSFPFYSTISASNANSVTDGAVLNCANGKQVKLNLVPSSVHVYSKSYGFQGLSDSAVNGNTALGSPVAGSGDMDACWDYRIIVVYEVKVQVVTPPPAQATATCDLLNVLSSSDRKVKVTQFAYTATNTSASSVVLNWGDNTAPVTLTGANLKDQVEALNHQYANDGMFMITAVVNFDKAPASGGPNTNCAKPVSFTSNGTPNTPSTPVTPAASTTSVLPNTGAGSVAAIFAAAAAIGTYGYRKMLSRRLNG